MNIHHIELDQPIWHERAVGLNLMNCGSRDMVQVDILYKRKDGRRTYPDPFYVTASRAITYPSRTIHGAVIHFVPIAELSGSIELEENLRNINTTNDMAPIFSKDEVNNLNKAARDREASFAGMDQRPIMPPGVHQLKIKAIEAKTSAKKAIPMLQVIFEHPSGQYRDLERAFFFSGTPEAVETNKSRLVELFYRGFEHDMKEADSTDDLAKQLVKYQGRTLPVAVQNRQKLHVNKQGKTMVVTDAEYYYCGKEGTSDLTMDPLKKLVPLTAEDQAKLAKITQEDQAPTAKASTWADQ